MDLAKIIGELRVELQCLDAAIASIENLARVQNVLETDATQLIADEDSGAGIDTAEIQPEKPVKRKRGRPPKNPAPEASASPPAEDEPPQPIPPTSAAPEKDDSSESAA